MSFCNIISKLGGPFRSTPVFRSGRESFPSSGSRFKTQLRKARDFNLWTQIFQSDSFECDSVCEELVSFYTYLTHLLILELYDQLQLHPWE